MTASNEGLTVGDMAKMFNISPNTIRNYTEKFEDVFSDMATRRSAFKSARQRLYTPHDLFVMNTIVKRLPSQKEETIIRAIINHDLDDDLPETSALVLPSGAISMTTIATLRNDLATAHDEIERLRTFIDDLQAQHKADIERLSGTSESEKELIKQVAVMEYQIEMLKKQIEESKGDE